MDDRLGIGSLDRLGIGSLLRFVGGGTWIVHTCAYKANEKCFVGIVQVDVRPGNHPNTRWLSFSEAEAARRDYENNRA